MKKKIKTLLVVILAIVGIVLLSGFEDSTGAFQWGCAIPGIICLILTMILSGDLCLEQE